MLEISIVPKIVKNNICNKEKSDRKESLPVILIWQVNKRIKKTAKRTRMSILSAK